MVRAGERPTISFGGKGMSEYLLTPAHERRMQAILSDIAPGGGSKTIGKYAEAERLIGVAVSAEDAANAVPAVENKGG